MDFKLFLVTFAALALQAQAFSVLEAEVTTDSGLILDDETTSSADYQNDQVASETTQVPVIPLAPATAFKEAHSASFPFLRDSGASFGNCACGQKRIQKPLVALNSAAVARSATAFEAKKGLEPLIIPAIPADEREFPWLAAIQKKKWDGRWHVICSGSVINSRFVVTAAHCINTQSKTRLRLAFNAHNLSSSTLEDFETRSIARFIVHPGWNTETVDNDIGLIELEEPLNFAETDIRPVCLPYNTTHDAFDGQNATVAGWGFVSPGGPNSKVLNKVTVPILSARACREDTIYLDKILESMICAGFDEGGVDACTNDSGGPLVIDEETNHKLVGIVSWGHGCAKPKSPGVYTRVTRYVDWIVNNSLKGEWCLAH